MREMVTLDEVERELTAILSDATHPHFMKALAYVTEHGYGKATEHVEQSGAGGAPIVVRIIREGKRRVS